MKLLNIFVRFLVAVTFVFGVDLLRAADAGPAPVTAAEWIARGVELSRNAEYRQAADAFSEAVEIQPTFADAYLNRAIMFVKLGEWKKAEADCTKAIELDADNARSYQQRAVARSQLGLREAAFADASRAVRMEPADPGIVFTRYLTCSRMGRHELCHFSGETYIGIQRWSDKWSPYMALLNSVSLRRAGYEEESQSILNEASKWLNNENWPMPLVLYLQGKLDAENLMERATDDERRTLAHYYIGVNEWLNGDVPSAKPHLEWVRDNGSKDFLQSMLAEDHLNEIAATE